VLLAVVKLLGRIVSPEGVNEGEQKHDHTFGITSDPMINFATAFATIIHDVGHPGVPNSVLVSEGHELAIRYHDRSVSEQNSVDLAFGILLGDKFTALRETIYQTPEEFTRFRKLVVHNVMATDLWDAKLNQMRNERWDKAFSDLAAFQPPTKESADRKASIVLEHLITASDISHCMQHWAIYLKWNENLFQEQYDAYNAGRSATNPADYWYAGELSFFDNYVLPLAKKLKSCGIFGVSSVEYLDYAVQNRNEWAAQGHKIVAEYANNALEQTSSGEEESPSPDTNGE
jgi:3'5'-cyclic nucleotide phosphodiesterase